MSVADLPQYYSKPTSGAFVPELPAKFKHRGLPFIVVTFLLVKNILRQKTFLFCLSKPGVVGLHKKWYRAYKSITNKFGQDRFKLSVSSRSISHPWRAWSGSRAAIWIPCYMGIRRLEARIVVRDFRVRSNEEPIKTRPQVINKLEGPTCRRIRAFWLREYRVNNPSGRSGRS